MELLNRIFFNAAVILAIAVFANTAFAMTDKECASQETDELPVVTIIDKKTNEVIMDGDVIQYDNKLGLWLIIDDVAKTDRTFNPKDIIIANMCGKYEAMPDGRVQFVSTTGKNVVRLAFDEGGFEQTTINNDVDSQILNALLD